MNNNFTTVLVVCCFALILGVVSVTGRSFSNSRPDGGEEPSAPLSVPQGSTYTPASASPTGNDQPVVSDGTGSAAAGPITQDGQGAYVTGRVVDQTGMPIADAVVAVPSGSAPVPEIALRTSSDGTYSWRLPSGKFTIEIHKDGYAAQSAEVTVKANTETVVNFALSPQ